jgi:hypothetical protein
LYGRACQDEGGCGSLLSSLAVFPWSLCHLLNSIFVGVVSPSSYQFRVSHETAFRVKPRDCNSFLPFPTVLFACHSVPPGDGAKMFAPCFLEGSRFEGGFIAQRAYGQTQHAILSSPLYTERGVSGEPSGVRESLVSNERDLMSQHFICVE